MTKANPLPSQEILSKLFDYNTKTGCLIWKDRGDKRVPVGKPAGHIVNGYMIVRIQGTYFLNHRLIWKIITGDDPLDQQIDHIDGNRLNNNFENLRLASNSENQQNRMRPCSNTSGFKGVNWCKRRNKWAAKIGFRNRRFSLGYFDTPELAHMAYCKAAAELHGEFARGA